MRRVLSTEDHVAGVLRGDRAVLARTLTLLESTLAADRAVAEDVLEALLPHSGGAHRVGVSGPPGVGKSTLLEALGTRLLDTGRRVAVLAIDPSSARTGGSILGDKTRMPGLAADPRALVRPSPASGTLGGVHRATREAIRVVEAAGFDVVLVETVGVGQSEVEVASMVDTMLLLLLAGAGDELQGIKKGILEVADVLAVTKADGPGQVPARRAARELQAALHLVAAASPHWTPEVLTCSAVSGEGLDGVWDAVERHRAALTTAGVLEARRAEQRLAWLEALAEAEVLRRFAEDPGVASVRAELEDAVRRDALTPGAASRRLLAAWGRGA